MRCERGARAVRGGLVDPHTLQGGSERRERIRRRFRSFDRDKTHVSVAGAPARLVCVEHGDREALPLDECSGRVGEPAPLCLRGACLDRERAAGQPGRERGEAEGSEAFRDLDRRARLGLDVDDLWGQAAALIVRCDVEG